MPSKNKPFSKKYTKKQTISEIRRLLKSNKRLTKADFVEGNTIFTRYIAKDQTKVFDKTPFVLILRVGSSHTLGLNFHWIPMRMRMWLVRYIVRENKNNIKNGRRIQFSYRKIRPLLKKLGYAPCIRLYINSRLQNRGVLIPPERLIEITPLASEAFTGMTEEQLYGLAKAKRI